MNSKASNNNLSEILNPISSDLKLFEQKMMAGLSSSNPFLDKVTSYIIQSGGKRLRPAVTILFAKSINNQPISSEIFNLCIALELIHTATLIHDDVIDSSNIRRGIETINEKWNNQTAVIAGDYLLSKSLKSLVNTGNNKTIEIFADVMNNICVGEIQQNIQEKDFISLDEYIEKSKRKTALLFMAGCKSSAIIIDENNSELINTAENFAENFGIAFQIIDDVLNFTSSEKEMGKPIGDDLKNGIITAPVILAMNECSDKLKNLLNNENYEEAFELVIQTSGVQKAIELAQDYINKAIDSLNNMEMNEYKSSLIALSEFVINRNS